MKIAILHHDLEPSEIKIKEILEKKGFQITLRDIREANPNEFIEMDLVLNRVYASVANRDFKSISKTLSLLKILEEKGIKCINSFSTSLYDYSKFASYKKMKENAIPTPKTILIKSKKEIKKIFDTSVKELGFPIVIKRNTGGRGKDITRAKTNDELINKLKQKFEMAKKEKYYGGFILQKFIKSSKEHDCRIGVINKKFAFSYKRSLVSTEGKDKWLASTSKGSTEGSYKAKLLEKQLGEKASQAIGAIFNEIDVMFTENGPIVIENNPTPNYFVSDNYDLQRLKKFTESIIKNKI